MVAKNFVPSLESLSPLGFEERNLGCPGNFAGMSRTLGVFKNFVQKKFVCIFRSLAFPAGKPPKCLEKRAKQPLAP